MAVDTYYFDGSGGISDPDNAWSNDSNAFNNNLGNQASAGSYGSDTENYLQGTGTTSPTTGDIIDNVRVRAFGIEAVKTRIYHGSESLGTAITTVSDSVSDWGDWVTLSAPVGGFSWSILNGLTVRAWWDVGDFGGGLRKVELEVTSTPPTSPIVTTTTVTEITKTEATVGGNVSADGGANITQRGICWNTSPSPTTSNNVQTVAGTTGTFSTTITGLEESTLYYVRAFAINAIGTSYGNEVNFTTLGPMFPGIQPVINLPVSSVTPTNLVTSNTTIINLPISTANVVNLQTNQTAIINEPTIPTNVTNISL